MSLSRSFYKASAAVGHGIATAFNWASGRSTLDKNNVFLSSDHEIARELPIPMFSSLGAVGAGLATGLLLAPVIGPFAVAAGIAAGTATLFTPAHLHASYLVGKKQAQEAAAQSKNKIKL